MISSQQVKYLLEYICLSRKSNCKIKKNNNTCVGKKNNNACVGKQKNNQLNQI